MRGRLVERFWGGASFSHMSRCFCACPCRQQGQPVVLWTGRKRVSEWPSKMCFMQHSTEPLPTGLLPNRELYISHSGTIT
ncbi:hypothetical protein ASPBRDRAFT_54479 [Aspergillus brasiliensis CBS 101740]|uniref:Uncharacterized protein n=1 Tax=Aspergillus brasiliensis (strain CBS 101740 / IMI 381727 / IBT 21946) TaxID=767769 RepID=A0A1L9ULX0_ASPBC|nr:hypothetical protein ASPBRDRAFT_54479 [Aspergillus brasiliensis CBS 101740]